MNPDETSQPEPAPRRSVAAAAVAALIRAYRWTAPARSPRCRFYPTCSTYALEAVRTHGAARGSWLAVRRLGRCHPWNPGGVDHVPSRDRHRTASDPASPARTSRK